VQTGRPSKSEKRGDALHAVANFDPSPITSAERDAVKASLLPLVNALLAWKDIGTVLPIPVLDSSLPQFPVLEGS
jgi:hypothetical protein